jgi:hypothetical protein
MLWSTIVQIFKSKYLIVWAVQKWQILRSIIVNSADFEISQSVRVCLFCTAQNIRNLEFKLCMLVDHIIVKIWNFFRIFWNFKILFSFLLKKELYVARATKIHSLVPRCYWLTYTSCYSGAPTNKFGLKWSSFFIFNIQTPTSIISNDYYGIFIFFL